MPSTSTRPNAVQGRKPLSPRQSTEEKIIDAAEHLFGRFGIEGVSLRQIATVVETSNHSSVQYYFGDKDGLVRAILDRRLQVLETRRSELLADLTQSGRLDRPRALFEVLLRPIGELRDERGARSYAAFLLCLRSTLGGRSGPRLDAAESAPLTEHIQTLLRLSLQMPEVIYRRRVSWAATLYLETLVDLDDPQSRTKFGTLDEDLVLLDALDAATAILTAPIAAELLAAAAQRPSKHDRAAAKTRAKLPA